MTVLKTSISLDDRSRGILDERMAPGEDRAQWIRSMLDRYDEIVRRDLPALSAEEWEVLGCVLLDPAPMYAAIHGRGAARIRTLFAEISDHLAIDARSLAPHHGAEVRALPDRLAQMSMAELVAIVDEQERRSRRGE